MRPEITQELLALVKRGYNDIAADFDMTRKKAIWPEIKKLAAEVQDGEAVLDAGCGNGRLLEVLPARVEYLGVDNSEELIKLARRNYPNHKFVVADILNLDSVPKQSFDQVFCLAVLQHIPSRELRVAALQQLADKLKPSGRLVISVWNLWQSPKHRLLLLKNYWSKILGQGKLDYGDLLFPWKNSGGQEVGERYYHAFTKQELRQITRLAGLKIENFNRDKYNYWLILHIITP